MIKEILTFSKEDEINFNKLLNNEEIDVKKNLNFFKLLSEKAKLIDKAKDEDVTDDECRKMYIICYYRGIYEDYMDFLRRNSTK